ncbi:MAG: alpha/beta hydrolase [Oscillospiraceae bacterium]|nr:alpha/beta hydrolase [Oscillospiraceae bacterium]
MDQHTILTHGDLQIPIKTFEPDYATGSRVLIAVHGFGGDMQSSVIGAIAEEMGFYNTHTIAFDFPAHGESPMHARDLTLDNCIGCLNTVVDYAVARWPQAGEYAVLASSFGAYIALLAIDDLKEKLGRFKMVLRCPAVRMNKTFLKIARTDAEGLMKKGRIICGYERKMELGYDFFEQLQANNAVADHDMPMLILQGDRDELIDLEDTEFFRLLNSKSCLVMIPGATHRFNHEGELDMIVDLARDWYLCEEVLLCEYK